MKMTLSTPRMISIAESVPRLSKAPADLAALSEERRDPRRLFTVLHDGVRGSDMPSWQALEEEELWDLVAYLRALAAGPGAATEATP